MKNTIYLSVIFICLIIGCNSTKSAMGQNEKIVSLKNNPVHITKKEAKTINDTIRIANDSLEYEVIIIDPGFGTWLVSRSFPRGYLSQAYMENKNTFYINEWNNRVMQPQRFNPNLYEMTIDYDHTINYGYEVNYLIYNYMIYFQNTFKQQLFGFVPLQ